MPKRPFLPDGLWLVIKHGLFAFGTVVAAAVLWQRFAGTVVVGVPVFADFEALVEAQARRLADQAPGEGAQSGQARPARDDG